MNTIAHESTNASADAADEQAFVQRLIAGDRQSFELMMRRHNRRLYRLARATLRSDADAEDALQEAYLAAYRSLSRYRGEASLATWLSRLVLNECLGRLRRQKRRDNIAPMHGSDVFETEAEMHPAVPGTAHDIGLPEETMTRNQIRTLIERRLDQLPEEFRIVFVLRSVEDLSVEETARSLDIPEATVRSRHHRARGLLRGALARDIDLAERDVFSFGGEHCDRIVKSVLSRLP